MFIIQIFIPFLFHIDYNVSVLQVVSFILIIVAAYGRVAAIVTSLTLVGSIIACGVFLFLIALIGLVGAAKHHQVLLFFVSLILIILGQFEQLFQL